MKNLDIQKRLQQHVKLCNETKKWISAGLAHVKAGDMAKAQRAYEKAETIFAKARKLEK